MRRLQSNLAYLAAIADRSHKPSSQVPSHPTIISAPPLPTIIPKHTKPTNLSDQNTKDVDSASLKVEGDGGHTNGVVKYEEGESPEERAQTLRTLYARLQALFPGVDPKKEPPLPTSKPAQKPGAQQQGQAQKQAQTQKPGGVQNNSNVTGMGSLPGGRETPILPPGMSR
jgi:hypothetical protein